MKQKDLAAFLGISAPSASDLWKGRVPYSIDRLDAIADWLGVSIADLLGRDGPTDPTAPHIMTGWRTRRTIKKLIRPISHEFVDAA